MPIEPPRSPDHSTIQRLACSALQSRSVTIEPQDGYIFRTFSLRTPSPGFFYLLRCRPSSTVHLLRHEDGWLEAEAGVLQTLSSRPNLLIPRLITYQPGPKSQIGLAYLISGPFSGALLSDVEPSLSSKDLASIDLSLGSYVRRLAEVKGELFGSVWLSDREGQSQRGLVPRRESWARTFAYLLDGVMRDGEDALINLPYDGIRGLVSNHRTALDQITQPCLMLLELCSDKNIVVDTRTNRVTGLTDFSTALWGDPYLSDCFCKPTPSFVEGFGRLPNKSKDERTRQYLYILYHALLAIVRAWYRPRIPSGGLNGKAAANGNGNGHAHEEGDGEELEARRTLTIAIRQLSGG